MENEEVTTVQSDNVSFTEITEASEESVTDYPVEVVTTYDIEVVTTPDVQMMYNTIHQDLTNICGVLSIMLVLAFIVIMVRYINKIYHYIFH